MEPGTKKRTHNVAVEGKYFEEFIISALEEYEIERRNEYLIHDESASRSSTRFDAFLPNGLPPYTYRKTFLEIKYANNVDFINRYVSRTLSKIPQGYRLIIVCLISEQKKMFLERYDNVTVLGADYVGELANLFPINWLAFSASCSPEDNVISYDDKKDTFTLANKTLASSEVKMNYQFRSEDVKKLSDINKKAFENELSLNSNPALFIGNGASVCFGSDLWKPLCDYLFDYLNPKYVDSLDLVRKAIGDSTFSLSSMTKYLIDSNKYYSAIYSSLYRKYEDSMHDSSTLIRAAVKIKDNMPNMPVITYNYDDFFEIDYAKFCNRNIASVKDEQQDNSTSEPKVRHVHGLFPYGKSTLKPSLVLTQEEYYDAYRTGTCWTPSIQKHTLENYTCLFIGSSMSDLYQMSIINEVYYEKTQQEFARPWRCYALLCFKSLTSRDIYSVYNYYASKGVYVIFTEEFKDLPEELLTTFGMK